MGPLGCGRVGVVGDLGDHFIGLAELNAAGVADGGVEGAEDEFSALEVDGAGGPRPCVLGVAAEVSVVWYSSTRFRVGG